MACSTDLVEVCRSELSEAETIGVPFLTFAMYSLEFYMIFSVYRMLHSLYLHKHEHHVGKIRAHVENGGEMKEIVASERLKWKIVAMCSRFYDSVSPATDFVSEKWLTLVYWVIIHYLILYSHGSYAWDSLCHVVGTLYFKFHSMPMLERGVCHTCADKCGHVYLDVAHKWAALRQQMLSTRTSTTSTVTPTKSTKRNDEGSRSFSDVLLVLFAGLLSFLMRGFDLLLKLVGKVVVGSTKCVAAIVSVVRTIPTHVSNGAESLKQQFVVLKRRIQGRGRERGSNKEIAPVVVINTNSPGQSPRDIDGLMATPAASRDDGHQNNNNAAADPLVVHAFATAAEVVVAPIAEMEEDDNNEVPANNLNNNQKAKGGIGGPAGGFFRKPAKYISFRLTRKSNSSSNTVATTTSTASADEFQDHHESATTVRPSLKSSASFFRRRSKINEGNGTNTSNSNNNELNATALAALQQQQQQQTQSAAPLPPVQKHHSFPFLHKRSKEKDCCSSSSSSGNNDPTSHTTTASLLPPVGEGGCAPHHSCIIC